MKLLKRIQVKKRSITRSLKLKTFKMNIKTILPMMMIAAVPMTGFAQKQAGIKESNLDRTVRPADD